MDYSIKELSNDERDKWDSFLLESEKTLLFHSWKYKLLLEKFLGAKPRYLCLFDKKSKIKSALPLFYLNTSLGVVINSLPFYGSHGGVLEFDGKQEYIKAILKSYKELTEEKNVISATLITSPFEPNHSNIKNNLNYEYKAERIGQVLHLPEFTGFETIDDVILKTCHYKTRNMIRKSIKNGFKFTIDNSEEAWNFLIKIHYENMLNINGIPKPTKFFHLVKEIFTPKIDYDIWLAKKEGNICAAMLIFKFNKTVEYFTPAIDNNFRSQQPLSGIIFNAVKASIIDGYKYWNWGGTWLNQDGVYRFKSRWGTNDYPYYYYTRLKRKDLLKLTPKEVLLKFPYFYVLPFSELKGYLEIE